MPKGFQAEGGFKDNEHVITKKASKLEQLL